MSGEGSKPYLRQYNNFNNTNQQDMMNPQYNNMMMMNQMQMNNMNKGGLMNNFNMQNNNIIQNIQQNDNDEEETLAGDIYEKVEETSFKS